MAASAAYGTLPMTCRTCRLPGAQMMRDGWGCDRPTVAPLYQHPCVRCSGEDPDCGRCFGAGVESVNRCPHAVVTRDSVRVVEAANWLLLGHLPAPGAMSQQSATFVRAVQVVLTTKRRIDNNLGKVLPDGNRQ